MIDLFKIDWCDSWFEPMDGDSKYSFGKEEKKPTFKKAFEDKVAKHKLSETRNLILAFDCNGRKSFALDGNGELAEDLQGPHLARKADNGQVSKLSFPMQFQRRAPGEKGTMAVRPCSLRIREDDSLDKLRFRKIEMSVGATHKKPELDGQFGELGPFQATKRLWAVRPDHRGLWDVKVDGSPCPVSLRSLEVLDESSGAPLRDPVRISAWDRVKGEKALYAATSFRHGMVILEDEPAMFAKAGDNDIVWIWQQFKSLSSDQQATVLDLTRGPEYLWRFWKRDGPRKDQKEVYRKNAEELSESFRNLKPSEQEIAFNVIRTFDCNFFLHTYMDGGLLFLALARINHSCQPNAITGDPKVVPDSHEPCKKVLIAQRDIAEDEEITISYLGEDELLEPLAERRKRLRRFGFECACTRCMEEEAEGDALVRRFRCTVNSSCSGVHGAGPQGLLPCSFCGSAAKDSESVLSTEEIHVSVYTSLAQNLSAEKPLMTPDPFVEVVEGATLSGLAPEHWIVCKARDILSCFYEKGGRFALAADNLQPIMNLSERVLGHRGWLRVESLADHHLQLGRFSDSFESYALALQAVKRASPEHPVGQHFRCERIRGKLRSAIDAQVRSSEKTLGSGYA